MLRLRPGGPRRLQLAALLILALLPILARASTSRRATGAELAAAKLELAALLDSLETTLAAAPAAPALAPFDDQVSAAWLEGEDGPVDLELARRRCRPRYGELARAYTVLLRCLERDAADRAALIYEREVLPRALEISICLVAAEAALDPVPAPISSSGGVGP
jgi:hypothetical protein